MSNHRLEQIESKIQAELSLLFTRDLEFPQGCLVSISRVEVPPDLHWAKVWLSILPLAMRGKARSAIKKKQSYIQQYLNKNLKMKPTPRVKFMTDFTEEKAFGLEAVIDQALNEIA